MRTLMVLGGRVMQLPLIWRAHELGLRVLVLDPDPEAPGIALADARHVTDLANVDECVEVAHEHEVDGVLTFAADYPVRTAAAITTALGLPGPGLATAACATDKKLLRRALAAGGLASPRWGEVASPEAALRQLRSISGEAIIKPAMSSGGRGVTQVPSAADEGTVERAFGHATHFGDGTVMVEEFVSGPEFSVELAVPAGDPIAVAVTDKRSVGPPHWVEIGHSQPSAQPPSVRNQLIATAVAAARAMGMADCVAHVEIRLAEHGPVVIEAAARAAGGYIASHLVPLSTGIDLVEVAIMLALGEEPRLTSTHTCGAAVRFFDGRPGIITSVSGLEAARRSPGVEHIHLEVGAGDTLQPLQNATHRFGQVICTGIDGADAMKRCDDATRHLRIETRMP